MKLSSLKKIYFLVIVTFCFTFVSSAYAEVPQYTEPTDKQVAAHEEKIGSGPMARLNSGFINILTSPLELVDRPREEIKKTNLVYGILPGAIKGVGWAGARLAVGVWESLTFFLRHDEQPHLKPMDLDWLTA